MSAHSFIRRFVTDRTAASAAEFALVLPPFLLFLLGIFDVGRFIWFVNENEKAAQIGARWAVATDIIPGGEIGCDTPGSSVAGLQCYSYSINGITPQGGIVAEDDFPTVTCTSTGGTLSCECEATCPFSTDIDDVSQSAFNRMVRRMQAIQPRLAGDDVSISYAWSGLGYSGDPNGADVAPIVTVSIGRLDFQPLFMAGFLSIGIPGASYSLTMEDGAGTTSN
ncbi:TadE/TadG family type IV pilus assembly protein [Tsuneonella sp. HG094]